jgi:4-hydroxybenzoate polyprenyltransferase
MSTAAPAGPPVATFAPAPARPSRWLPYAQLTRIPNVFTAWADIALAALVTGSLPWEAVPFFFLLLSSGCLYCGGMVWNDYFDFEQDLKERPFRPLPSYRVGVGTAARLGWGLFAAGVFFAALAGIGLDGWTPTSLILALVLVGAIFAYDGWLKRNFLGPISMGLCRFLNVLLGLSVAADGIPWWGVVLALVVGVYITGVTWFARREARVSKQLELAAAALVMLTALLLALFLPVVATPLARGAGNVFAFVFGELGHVLFPYLLVAFGFYVGLPAWLAIRTQGPRQVQAAVKRAVLGLIVLDAVLASALAGTVGLLLLALLPPALYLGKWVYST